MQPDTYKTYILPSDKIIFIKKQEEEEKKKGKKKRGKRVRNLAYSVLYLLWK